MAFLITPSLDGANTPSGQTQDIFAKLILSTDKFEDGLQIGRFAKLDTGSIDNLDASTTPVIAGVVLRCVTNAIEDGSTYNADNTTMIEYQRAGVVTVEVKAGQTPAVFGAVTAHNVADADAGKALATGGVATGAEFLFQVTPTVWAIRLK